MSITASRGLLYDAGPGWQAVMLPYLGRQLAMVADRPRRRALRRVRVAASTARMLQTVLDALRPTPLDLDMPRFQFTTQSDLAGAAGRDWAPPACSIRPRPACPASPPTRPLWLAAVDQQSFLSADEEGSQASAPTAVLAPARGRTRAPSRSTWTDPSWWPWSTGPAASPSCSAGSSTRSPSPLVGGLATEPAPPPAPQAQRDQGGGVDAGCARAWDR